MYRIAVWGGATFAIRGSPLALLQNEDGVALVTGVRRDRRIGLVARMLCGLMQTGVTLTEGSLDGTIALMFIESVAGLGAAKELLDAKARIKRL